jgi:hypothetical protein
MVTAIRLGALALGVSCAGLGAFGAYEFAHKLEGGVTYLVLAAPLIAVSAAFIPPIAELTWRRGHFLKAALWWTALVPAAAVVFYSAAERVHVAKAGAQAERSALRSAAARAQATLTKAEAELAKARADANKARGQKQCGPDCRTKLAAEAAATADVNAARRELLLTEKTATTDSPLQAPTWLLPAALDLVAFMAIWTALSGYRSRQARKPVQVKRRAAAKRKPSAPKATDTKARAEALSRRTANDNTNVVPFNAA